ncbi:hypothetical protein ACQKMD_20140 [Viridibacillus sp. NPDC096237]|uniref:hypothetical protein n=1 Tax=Viridibacillus sp. NPDC096237 TaxID=3390721 RepID=UPI003D08B506
MSKDYSKHNQYESQTILSRDIPSNLNSFTDLPDKNHRLPFSVIMTIPKGFHMQKQDPKLVYDVSYLSMTKETCKKSIEVDHCGHVEVDLHALKIKGCVSFFLNLFIEPIHTQHMCTTNSQDASLSLCCQETVYIDHVLKYSVSTLPYYVIDDDHIQVRHLDVQTIDADCQTVKVSGVFLFEYE